LWGGTLRPSMVRTDEDPLCEIRNFRCCPEEDLRASGDSNAGPRILGEKRSREEHVERCTSWAFGRSPGMADQVVVAGRGSYWHAPWSDEELRAPLPPPPEFPESIEAVRERIARVIGKLTVPRDVGTWHPAIDRLLKEDEKRREKQLVDPYPMSWNDPLFDTPIERRRLCILNTVFLATARVNGKPTISGREAHSVHLTFYQQHVGIRLDRPKRPSRRSYSEQNSEPSDTRLCFSILESLGSDKERISWQDDEGSRLETRLAEIAVQLVLTSELQHRESAIRQYQWRAERKAQVEEEERERKLKDELAERERRKSLERARIERLLRDAAAFQQAGAIREYVKAIRLAQSSSEACSAEALGRWTQWALSEADRIDPAVGRAFLTAMRDEDGAREGLLSSGQ
jgi:hypothetical protein